MVDKDKYRRGGIQKHSIFDEGGNLRLPKPGSSPTICDTNMQLAKMVNDSSLLPDEKADILDMLDILYDMGKRMGTKLRDYHREFVERGLKHGGWREGY